MHVLVHHEKLEDSVLHNVIAKKASYLDVRSKELFFLFMSIYLINVG